MVQGTFIAAVIIVVIAIVLVNLYAFHTCGADLAKIL